MQFYFPTVDGEMQLKPTTSTISNFPHINEAILILLSEVSLFPHINEATVDRRCRWDPHLSLELGSPFFFPIEVKFYL